MSAHEDLLRRYMSGIALLRAATAGLTREQAQSRPVAGRWSTLEVVCHLADFEPIFADRIKRVLAENEPELLPGDENRFAARLAYQERDIEEELTLIEMVRRQLGRILATATPADFQRIGHHRERGAVTLQSLLELTTRHLEHHLPFLLEKRQALGLADPAF